MMEKPLNVVKFSLAVTYQKLLQGRRNIKSDVCCMLFLSVVNKSSFETTNCLDTLPINNITKILILKTLMQCKHFLSSFQFKCLRLISHNGLLQISCSFMLNILFSGQNSINYREYNIPNIKFKFFFQILKTNKSIYQQIFD